MLNLVFMEYRVEFDIYYVEEQYC